VGAVVVGAIPAELDMIALLVGVVVGLMFVPVVVHMPPSFLVVAIVLIVGLPIVRLFIPQFAFLFVSLIVFLIVSIVVVLSLLIVRPLRLPFVPVEFRCAGCACVAERGVRVVVCGDPTCCCSDLPTADRAVQAGDGAPRPCREADHCGLLVRDGGEVGPRRRGSRDRTQLSSTKRSISHDRADDALPLLISPQAEDGQRRDHPYIKRSDELGSSVRGGGSLARR
jgi:hypothetical protein